MDNGWFIMENRIVTVRLMDSIIVRISRSSLI